MHIRKCATIGLMLGGIALTGCTAVRVQPISSEHQIHHICIKNNPRVTVGDFVPVMQEGFNKHGITSQVIAGEAGKSCPYTATYTARRSWDISTYLSQAQIDVQRNGQQIATAHYHLRNKGGLSLTKWASTRSKILPVIDQLLAQVRTGGRVLSDAPEVQAEVAEVPVANAQPPSTDLAKKLGHLKDAYDAQLITQAEYDVKRKELIDEL